MTNKKLLIPKECIKLCALEKAQDLNITVEIKSLKEAIKFLTSVGVKVEEQ